MPATGCKTRSACVTAKPHPYLPVERSLTLALCPTAALHLASRPMVGDAPRRHASHCWGRSAGAPCFGSQRRHCWCQWGCAWRGAALFSGLAVRASARAGLRASRPQLCARVGGRPNLLKLEDLLASEPNADTAGSQLEQTIRGVSDVLKRCFKVQTITRDLLRDCAPQPEAAIARA